MTNLPWGLEWFYNVGRVIDGWRNWADSTDWDELFSVGIVSPLVSVGLSRVGSVSQWSEVLEASVGFFWEAAVFSHVVTSFFADGAHLVQLWASGSCVSARMTVQARKDSKERRRAVLVNYFHLQMIPGDRTEQ